MQKISHLYVKCELINDCNKIKVLPMLYPFSYDLTHPYSTKCIWENVVGPTDILPIKSIMLNLKHVLIYMAIKGLQRHCTSSVCCDCIKHEVPTSTCDLCSV